MGKGGKGASAGAAAAAKKKGGGSGGDAGLGNKHDAGADEGEETPFIKDDLAAAHNWKPIKRSYLRGSPLENSG